VDDRYQLSFAARAEPRAQPHRYLIHSAAIALRINRRPVAGRQTLRSGDRVEVGGTLFIFRERAQAAQG
jgi:hypothetical protein